MWSGADQESPEGSGIPVDGRQLRNAAMKPA
jgi:hypothetical protein